MLRWIAVAAKPLDGEQSEGLVSLSSDYDNYDEGEIKRDVVRD